MQLIRNLFIISIVIFVAIPLSGQTWQNIESPGLSLSGESFPGDYHLDLYTDQDGNHLIIRKDSEIAYYLFSSDGTQIRSTTLASSLGEEGFLDNRLAQVTGWDGNVYVVYIEGGKLRAKRSSNAGQTWSTLSTRTMNEDLSNGLQVWSDNDGVHTTWSEEQGGGSGYETHYALMKHSQSTWSDYKHVTDVTGEAGGFPSVTTSSNRVHVAYTPGNSYEEYANYGFDESRVREKVNSSWQSPVDNTLATNAVVVAAGSDLHRFYYADPSSPPISYDIFHTYRDAGGTSWASPQQLNVSSADPTYTPLDVAATSNDSVHFVFEGYDGTYRQWNGSNWSTVFDFSNSSYPANPQVAGNGNDVYVVWVASDDSVKIRQRDMAPVQPTGIAITHNSGGHPEISWSASP